MSSCDWRMVDLRSGCDGDGLVWVIVAAVVVVVTVVGVVVMPLL